MNPQTPFGHRSACPARGRRGQGTIGVQSPREQRDRGKPGGRTVAATKGPPCYRLRTTVDVVTVVLPLRCHGGPLHAMVAACGLDERSVAQWLARAGPHCQQVHRPVVHQGTVDLPQGQADARWATLVGRRVWMALARALPSRRWLGGVSGPPRDLVRITA
jgi:hypothetical protein